MKILYSGDWHACPTESHEDFDRFRALGHLIATEKPDVIVFGGDLGEFRSLLAHRGGSIAGGDGSDEGHDLLADLEAWKDAIRTVLAEYRRDNERHRRARHLERLYEPRIVLLFGNHEEKVPELARKHRLFRRLLSSRLLEDFAEAEGIEVFPFLEPAVIGGVVFQHYAPAQIRKQALPIDRHLGRGCESIITGHKHTFEHRSTRTATGKLRTAIVAGCFKSRRRLGRYEESGALMLHDVRDGEFRFEWLPIDAIERAWRAGPTSKGTPKRQSHP